MIEVSDIVLLNYIKEIMPDSLPIEKQSILEIVKNNSQIKNAIISFNIQFNINLENLDELYKFLTYVFVMDSIILINEDHKTSKFSKRMVLLLGKNSQQNDFIQHHLGTAYHIRHNLVHDFSLPNSEYFEKYFHKDIKEASSIIQVYLKLLILRLFNQYYNIIDLTNNIRRNNFYSIQKSPYDDFINDEINKLIEKKEKRIENFNDEINENDRENLISFVINTVGGILEDVEEENSFIEFEHFYENLDLIIPSSEIWKTVLDKLKKKIHVLNFQKNKKLKFIVKSHNCFLFSLGYYLEHDLKNVYLKYNYNYIRLVVKNKFQVNDLVEIERLLDSKSSKNLFLGFNFSDNYINEVMNEYIVEENINEYSILLFKLKVEKIETKNELFSILELINKQIEKIINNETIESIHVIGKIPSALVFLLAHLVKKFNFKKIILYERGKKEINQKENKYYPVIVL